MLCNIGIAHANIKSMKVISKYQAAVSESSIRIPNKQLPTVALLSFGGTIASRVDYRTGGVVADYGADDFYAMMPELSKIANIVPKKIMNIMSEDMNSHDWKTIATSVLPYLQDPAISGVVITQGTDTLHFSTAALSFMLKDINKPVVFTASQRSIDRGSSDAFINLICAVKAASTWNGACVVTCLHENMHDDACILIRGTKVRKMHTSRRDAFRPINEKPLARVPLYGDIAVLNPLYPQRNDSLHPSAMTAFEEKIAIVMAYPGNDISVIDHYVSKGYKGLVVAATALGHVNAPLVEKLGEAVRKGCLVIIASQTIYGRTHPHVYSRLRDMSIGHGMVFVEDMLVETAYTKLGWALAHSASMKDAAALMQKNIAGEMCAEIDETSYLN